MHFVVDKYGFPLAINISLAEKYDAKGIVPMRCISLASTSLVASDASSRVVRRRPRPSLSLMRSSRLCPSITACMTCQRRSVSERTSCHWSPSVDTERTQSPARRPARSATLEASGGPSTALGSSTPTQDCTA